ncbi:MAG TPA: CopD family protein [Methylomirabilota bacterium]|nr:CopD family protein [Methylomirabilota bacterium]
MTALVARFLHLACSILLVGGAALLLLAGPSDRPTARRWEARIVAACRVLVVLALAGAVVAVAAQTALLEGRPAAAFEPAALTRLLLQTQGGVVWLLRGGLLLLLGAFVAVRADLSQRVDWRAARGEVALLGLLALGLIAAASHAAAVEPGTATAIAADVVHLAASGLWVGALLPLALLLRLTARESGADARPYAVVATRRFSAAALQLALVVLLSGAWNTWLQVGSVAGLLGTRHGRLLVVKLVLVAAMLALAALNRRLIPRLSGDAASVGRPAMRRLGALVAGEAGLAIAVIGIVAVMSVTPPARHTEPVWPLSFRLSLDNLDVAPAFKRQALVGSQVAVLGVVALLSAVFVRRLRWPIAAGGAVVLLGGAAIALPPLVTDAYPTTFQRPTVPYQAAAIAEGRALFAAHCVRCHGPRGAGDGPEAATLTPRPADLRAHHINLHTAGDIFWWITHGKPPMPPFGNALSDEERWSLVNFLRALTAADQARLLGPSVDPDRPWLVAPDFTFAVGPTPARALKDYRGRKIVLLVLYTLPASRARLVQLAENLGLLATLDVEIVAAPTDADPDAVRHLGQSPPFFFSVVTDGAPDILATYRLFSPAPHAEFLIDRRGYLRAITAASGDTTRDPNLLLAEVQQLNQEKAPPPPPAEHVH